jgi:hypothetical protein
VDFTTLLALPAIVCWLAYMQPERAKLTRVLARSVGTLFVLYGAIVGLGTSITGYYDSLRVSHRSTYDTIGDALGFIPQFVTLFIGHPEIIKDTYNCGSGVCGTYEAALSHWNLYNGYDLELDVASPTAGWQVTFHMFDQDQRLSGDIVYLHNTGFVAIPLQGGLNRIDITVPGSRPISFYALQTSRIPPAKRGDSLVFLGVERPDLVTPTTN